MSRHDGSVVDTCRRLVRDRRGVWHPVERLQLATSGLYYARVWVDDALLTYSESWLLPRQGWVIHRIAFQPSAPIKPDWYIEIDPIEVSDGCWHQLDGYLDLYVFEGSRYELLDADELAEGLVVGDIFGGEVAGVLGSLDQLCRALTRLEFSGQALLREYARGLPQ